MEISNEISLYKEEIINIAYEKYKDEMSAFPDYALRSKTEIEHYIKERFPELKGVVHKDDLVTGYLLYYTYKDKQTTYCTVPVWGYGAMTKKKEKIMTRMFQKIADKLVGKGNVHFQINLYAHDIEIQRVFSFMEFGIQCENGIRKTEKKPEQIKSTIRELSKEELNRRWKEVWTLLERLINHLRKSPVFYPGTEFTEDIYKEFFCDEATRVFIAEKEQKIVGLIEANLEENDFILGGKHSCNVGEAYVLEEYRGSGLAEDLLYYVDQTMESDGYQYEWVEHGTANPNARGYWNKYFDSYCYTMIRDIDGRRLKKK